MTALHASLRRLHPLRWLEHGFLRLSLGLKIALPPAFATVCLLLISGIAWFANTGLSDELHNVAHKGMANIGKAQRYESKLNELQLDAAHFITALSLERDPAITDAMKARLLVQLADFEGSIAEAQKALPSQTGAPDVPTEGDELADDLQAIADSTQEYRKALEKTFTLTPDKKIAIGNSVSTMSDAYRLLKDKVAILLGREENAAQASLKKGDELSALNRQLIVGFALLALVTSSLIAWVCTRYLTTILGQAGAIAAALEKGDLTRRADVKSSDAAGRTVRSLSDVAAHLSRLVANVRDAAMQVESAAGEIESGNHDLSRRTESQAGVLQEIAASMHQLSATVMNNAENARRANQQAAQASSTASRGSEVVGQVVETMKGIDASSRKISDILGVIDAIAFQTNILALNAAVEAARAGDSGRGFAVVAAEVRNLASRSAGAAKEIKGLIHDSVERVRQGSTLVDRAGATMADIDSAIRQVTGIMGEISSASSEQGAGVSQVAEAIAQIDQATQQNAALVEQMAASASGLKSQSSDLVRMVARFTLAPESAGQPRRIGFDTFPETA